MRVKNNYITDIIARVESRRRAIISYNIIFYIYQNFNFCQKFDFCSKLIKILKLFDQTSHLTISCFGIQSLDTRTYMYNLDHSAMPMNCFTHGSSRGYNCQTIFQCISNGETGVILKILLLFQLYLYLFFWVYPWDTFN